MGVTGQCSLLLHNKRWRLSCAWHVFPTSNGCSWGKPSHRTIMVPSQWQHAFECKPPILYLLIPEKGSVYTETHANRNHLKSQPSVQGRYISHNHEKTHQRQVMFESVEKENSVLTLTSTRSLQLPSTSPFLILNREKVLGNFSAANPSNLTIRCSQFLFIADIPVICPFITI